MPKYEVTFTGTYLMELPDLSEETRTLINESYEISLPWKYEDSDYLWGEVTYVESED